MSRIIDLTGLCFVVLFALAVSVACGARAQVMSGAFVACAKADLGQIIGGLPLETDVAAILDANATTLEAELGVLAAQVGIDAVECAIAAVEAAFPPATAGSGSATPTTSDQAGKRLAALARAHAFVAKWRATGGKP